MTERIILTIDNGSVHIKLGIHENYVAVYFKDTEKTVVKKYSIGDKCISPKTGFDTVLYSMNINGVELWGDDGRRFFHWFEFIMGNEPVEIEKEEPEFIPVLIPWKNNNTIINIPQKFGSLMIVDQEADVATTPKYALWRKLRKIEKLINSSTFIGERNTAIKMKEDIMKKLEQ